MNMDQLKLQLMFVMFMAFAGIITVCLIIYADKSTASRRKKGYISKYDVLRHVKKYHRYDNFFLTRGTIRKIFQRVSELSVYDSAESRVVAYKFFRSSTLAFIGLLVGSAFLFKDTFTWILIAIFAFVLKNVMVDKQIDKIHFLLINQLSLAISSIRQNYLRLGNIPDAIAESDVGFLVKNAMDDIYMILTATESEKRLEEFFACTPYRLLQTLATVCYNVNESGDGKTEDGSSNFLNALKMMDMEVQLEIRKLILQRTLFGSLEILPLAPVAALKGIEAFFNSTIPGTSVLYHGTFGYVSKIVIVALAIAGYYVIVKLNSAMAVSKDDRNGFITKLLQIHSIDQFIRDLLPKKSFKRKKVNDKLKKALSTMNLRHFYCKKVVYMLAMIILMSVMVLFAVDLGKEYIYDNVKEVSLVSGEKLTEADIILRKQVDASFMKLPELPKDRIINELVERAFPKMQVYDKQMQVERLKDKYTSYHNAYFRWWMVIVVLLLGGIGWFIPNMQIMWRAFILKTEAQDDVLQMQTLIEVLMYTPIDTIDILYWLWRQSRVHSRVLARAYHDFPSNPELALERLKGESPLPEFQRLVDKLKLTVSQISLQEAFSDLQSERNHIMSVREMVQTSTMHTKRRFASPIAKASLYATAILYVVAPLLILGVDVAMSSYQNFY